MKTKKLLILLITFMLAVGIIGTAAAGGKQEKSETKEAEEEGPAATETAEQETIVIGISKFVQHFIDQPACRAAVFVIIKA